MSTNGLVLGEGATRGPAAQGTSSYAGPSGPLVWLPAATAAVLAVPLFIYLPLELLDWSSSAAEEGRWLGAVFSTFLALVMVFVGTTVVRLLRYGICGVSARPAGLLSSIHWPRVSILVPAYNEGETIEAALESLLEESYPCYEVIVVDDGSSDDTLALARKFEGRHGNCTVRVHSKPNGGKWSALNLAFQRSTGEFVLCVDADSRLAPGSLHRLVARLSDPRVACVAGQVQVRNRVNVLTRLQAARVPRGLWLDAHGPELLRDGPRRPWADRSVPAQRARRGLHPIWHGSGPRSAWPRGRTLTRKTPLPRTSTSHSRSFPWAAGSSMSLGPSPIPRPQRRRSGSSISVIAGSGGPSRSYCKFFRRARLSPEMLSLRLIAW